MTLDILYPVGCFFLLLSGFLALIVRVKNPVKILACVAIPGLLLTILGALRVLVGYPLNYGVCKLAEPFGTLNLTLDYLGAFFVVIFSLVGIPVLLEAMVYASHESTIKGRLHAVGLSLLLTAMLVIPSIDNSYMFLAIWEIMTLASFLLVMHESERKETRKAAIYYLILMQIGAFALFGGFLLLNNQFQTVQMSQFVQGWNEASSLIQIGWSLLLVGFACKAGLVPLHSWLPIAHPAAPAHISALMSAAMIKVGIYGLIRVLSWISPVSPMLVVLLILWGMVTAIQGATLSLTRQDIKELLAASTVENAGLIVFALALGEAGEAIGSPQLAFIARAAAFLHIVHHALFKCLLFLAAGAVVHATNTRRIDELGGLQLLMPKTAFLFFAGGISAGALPLGNGFYSELLMVIALFYAAPLQGITGWSVLVCFSLVTLGIAGVFALVAWVKAYGFVFLGTPRQSKEVEDIQGLSFLAGVIPAIFLLLTIFFPQKTLALCLNPLRSLGGDFPDATLVMINNLLSTSTSLILIALLLGLTLLTIRYYLLRGCKVERGGTWACGYQSVTPRMQYTSSSFVRSFLVYVRPLLFTRMIEDMPPTFFPTSGNFSSKSYDRIGIRLNSFFHNVVTRLSAILGRLRVVSIQKMILQMVLFLCVLLLMMMMGWYGK